MNVWDRGCGEERRGCGVVVFAAAAGVMFFMDVGVAVVVVIVIVVVVIGVVVVMYVVVVVVVFRVGCVLLFYVSSPDPRPVVSYLGPPERAGVRRDVSIYPDVSGGGGVPLTSTVSGSKIVSTLISLYVLIPPHEMDAVVKMLPLPSLPPPPTRLGTSARSGVRRDMLVYPDVPGGGHLLIANSGWAVNKDSTLVPSSFSPNT